MLITTNENRNFKRMLVNIPIIIEQEGRKISGKCIDLSGTGMQLHSKDETLKVGDEVFIKLATENKRFPSLDVTATIVRVTQDENGYIGAVSFPVFN